MRFAGKAFIGGAFGALGVTVAILATAAVLTKLGERAIRNATSDYAAAYARFKEERSPAE